MPHQHLHTQRPTHRHHGTVGDTDADSDTDTSDYGQRTNHEHANTSMRARTHTRTNTHPVKDMAKNTRAGLPPRSVALYKLAPRPGYAVSFPCEPRWRSALQRRVTMSTSPHTPEPAKRRSTQARRSLAVQWRNERYSVVVIRSGLGSPPPRILVQTWLGWAQSRYRCGSREPSPGADVGSSESRRKCGSGEPSRGADVAGLSRLAAG